MGLGIFVCSCLRFCFCFCYTRQPFSLKVILVACFLNSSNSFLKGKCYMVQLNVVKCSTSCFQRIYTVMSRHIKTKPKPAQTRRQQKLIPNYCGTHCCQTFPISLFKGSNYQESEKEALVRAGKNCI